MSVTHEYFKVVYDGPAIAEHSMDVRELAPALLALADTFHQAQHILTPGAPRAKLSISAFEAGSFEVAMVLSEDPTVVSQVMGLLTGSYVGALAGVGTLASTVAGTLKAIKWLNGRRLKRVSGPQDGMTTLFIDDDTTLAVASQVVPLIQDVEYRRQVSRIVQPLYADGVDTFTITDTSISVHITRDEVGAFAIPEIGDEDLDVSTREVTLQILGIEFDRQRWRFSEGGPQFTAVIEDQAFRDSVERQEVVFGKNDLLRVRLRTRQYRDGEGKLKSEHWIEQVIRHIDGGRQIPLDFTE